MKALIALLVIAGCGTEAAQPDVMEVDHESSVPPTDSGGSGRVEYDGDERVLDARWFAKATIRQMESGAQLQVLINYANDDGDRVAVTILQNTVARPFTLVGDYPIGYNAEPYHSGAVTMEWDGATLHEPENGNEGALLHISAHEDGQIEGTLTTELDNGESVEATFEGEATVLCSVMDGEDWRTAGFDDPFCAPFFE